MRQDAGFNTAEESNKRYHYLLSQGVTDLSVGFDLPTQLATTATTHWPKAKWARSG